MRDSLFKRYVTAFGMTLLACTSLLGLALIYFSALSYTSQRQAELYAAANTAQISLVGRVAVSGVTNGIRFSDSDASKAVLDELKNIFIQTGITTEIADRNGTVLICSEGEDSSQKGTVLPESMRTQAERNGACYREDYFLGLMGKPGSYSCCIPVAFGGDPLGFIVTSRPIAPLFDYLSDMIITFLVSSGAMIVAATVIIFFATRSLVKPLHEITSAANKFGSGDFGARVTVSGDDEIARLARSFNNMANSLTAHENMRRGFVANVSHELRTPMTTIGGYIDGILDKTIPPEKEEHYLGIVSEEVKRLSRLTSSLLDVSRLEEGAVSASIVCLNVWDVILPVMASCESRISKKNIQVPDINDDPKYAWFDRDMFYQVIYNLVDNAIKFTPEGGTLSVTGTLSGGQVTVAVRNSGSGIKPEDLPLVFERFYKTDKSRSLDRTGTGLGLYITKTLTQKMGGDLRVSSELGEYTEFSVIMRAGKPPKH